jgi:hypothetical protein
VGIGFGMGFLGLLQELLGTLVKPPDVTCSSLSTFSIVYKCALLSASFCYSDFVHVLSRELYSLRRCFSTPRSSHSHRRHVAAGLG